MFRDRYPVACVLQPRMFDPLSPLKFTLHSFPRRIRRCKLQLMSLNSSQFRCIDDLCVLKIGVQGARAYGISRTFARVSETLPPENPLGKLMSSPWYTWTLVCARTTDIPAYCSAEISTASSTGTNTISLCTTLYTVT